MVDITVTEAARFQLRTAMGQILDKDAADTPMELLPATGWADVATRHDLNHVTAQLHRELGNFRLEMKSDLNEALLRQSRWFFSMLITVNSATVGVVFAAVKLL